MSNREIYDKACSFNQKYDATRYYWQLNYWGKLYTTLHPSKSQPNTDTRQKCMEVLKKALPWHLENTTNKEQRAEIQAAIKEINTYAG